MNYNVSTLTIALYIEGSAHHLDMRLENDADPPSLQAARAIELTTITSWINNYNAIHEQKETEANHTNVETNNTQHF